jgi:hypothetical protein
MRLFCTLVSPALGTEPRGGLFGYDHLHTINLCNAVSFVSGQADTAGALADALTIAKDTLIPLTTGISRNKYSNNFPPHKRKQLAQDLSEVIKVDDPLQAVNSLLDIVTG